MAEDRHGVDPEQEDADGGTGIGMPGTDDFLNQIASGMGLPGWPGLDPSPDFARRQVDEHRAEMKREADIFRDAFSTPAGRKCLDILVGRTLLRRTFGFEFEAKGLRELTVAAIVRESENNFVASILEAIAFANNQDVQVRQEA